MRHEHDHTKTGLWVVLAVLGTLLVTTGWQRLTAKPQLYTVTYSVQGVNNSDKHPDVVYGSVNEAVQGTMATIVTPRTAVVTYRDENDQKHSQTVNLPWRYSFTAPVGARYMLDVMEDGHYGPGQHVSASIKCNDRVLFQKSTGEAALGSVIYWGKVSAP